ncbi:putative homing endonuclease GIY-YIG family [Acinetobacter phage Ac42]|uniref:homing endonuclease n=1 Tax=Acinetobacter phage Ac42 TaxID=762660 RepID=UPI0001EBCE10|nr:homing endonuclease [Acinetobacter phage Ac42]ADI96468.1 putative homing endonuclease GIY-YIG family [Acinetobacter phage Ac42]
MKSGIYKIVNTETCKCYVGSAKDFQSRWNRHFKDLRAGVHSSLKLQRSFNKYGEKVFITEIIEEIEYEKELIIERENFWMSKLDSKKNGYNIADASFGDVLSTHPNRNEIIKKISSTINKSISLMTSEERKEKWGLPGYLNGMYGKTHLDSTKKILSELNKGNSNSKGRVMSEDQREKLSILASKRTGDLNPFYGKTHSDESKNKMAESRKGKPAANAMRVVVDGIEYQNRHVAETATGIKASTIWYRCNSKNKKYNDTYFID